MVIQTHAGLFCWRVLARVRDQNTLLEMEFITGEKQGSFLLSETTFWQESVVGRKRGSAKKGKAD